MEPIHEALRLMKRQSELETNLCQLGGVRVTEEREIYALRNQLRRYPQAVAAIHQTAANLRRPIDVLSVADIQRIT